MIDNMDAEREYSFSLNERDIITEAVNEFAKNLSEQPYNNEMCFKIVRKLWAKKWCIITKTLTYTLPGERYFC